MALRAYLLFSAAAAPDNLLHKQQDNNNSLSCVMSTFVTRVNHSQLLSMRRWRQIGSFVFCSSYECFLRDWLIRNSRWDSSKVNQSVCLVDFAHKLFSKAPYFCWFSIPSSSATFACYENGAYFLYWAFKSVFSGGANTRQGLRSLCAEIGCLIVPNVSSLACVSPKKKKKGGEGHFVGIRVVFVLSPQTQSTQSCS